MNYSVNQFDYELLKNGQSKTKIEPLIQIKVILYSSSNNE